VRALQGGVLTPSSAMGAVLIKRLREADIKFEITKTGKEVTKSPLDKLKAAQGSANKATGGASVVGAAGGRSAQAAVRRGAAFASVGMAHAHPVLRAVHRACAHRAQGVCQSIGHLQAGTARGATAQRSQCAVQAVQGHIGGLADRCWLRLQRLRLQRPAALQVLGIGPAGLQAPQGFGSSIEADVPAMALS
jgi:hypothetical protein